MGSHLLLHLTNTRERVRATYRDPEGIDRVHALFKHAGSTDLWSRIEWRQADITDLPALSEVFKDITVCYHTAALISFAPADYKSLRRQNIEGTANVVNTCVAQGVSTLCYLSSIAVLGTPLLAKPVNEESHWDPSARNSEYAISKYGAEMEVWRGSQEGLNTVIVNPGIILGESYDPRSSSMKMFKSGTRSISFHPKGGTGFTDISDLVKIMVRLTEEKHFGKRFIVVNSNRKYTEVLSAMAEASGKNPLVITTHRWMLYILYALSIIPTFLGLMKPSLSRSSVESLSKRKEFDNSAVESTLDVSLSPIEICISRICEQHMAVRQG